MRSIVCILLFLMGSSVFAQKANFEACVKFSESNLSDYVHSLSVYPSWIGNSDFFWYYYTTGDGTVYYLVDAKKGKKQKLFSTERLAARLAELTGKTEDVRNFKLGGFRFEEDNPYRLMFSKYGKDFEYDVYSLIKAFYPGCEITSWYEEDGALDGEFAYYDTITYEADQICFSIADEKHETLASQCEAVEYEKDRHETKNVLKRMVYRTLSEVSGKELPWGDLTGIRPTKIPMKMLEEGKKNVEIAKYMRETYYTSPEKTALAITIANREKDILKTIDYEHGYSLYIGIPFCPSICLYCSFGSHVLSRWEHMVDPYLDALIKELIFISENMKDYTLDTIYIGGGTPTTLNAAQMERLLAKVTELFPMEQVQEFTVEAGRPDTINEEVLKAIRKFPVTRISINPQTMNQETLDLIGRHHTVEEIEEKFRMARSLGFDNINMDLIVGLPGEDKEKVAHTLEKVEALNPDSLTVHSLALKRATRLNLFKDKYQEISFENSAEIMKMTMDSAHRMEMGPYYMYRQKNMAGNFENVGYSREGKAGIYNILIMEEKQSILAAGAGASTKFVFEHGERIERVENVKDLKNYVERIDEMIERKRIGMEKYLPK